MRRTVLILGAVSVLAGVLDCGTAVNEPSINGKPCAHVGEEKWTNTRHYVCEEDRQGHGHWVEQA